jgi:hypothetical protein
MMSETQRRDDGLGLPDPPVLSPAMERVRHDRQRVEMLRVPSTYNTWRTAVVEQFGMLQRLLQNPIANQLLSDWESLPALQFNEKWEFDKTTIRLVKIIRIMSGE